MPIIQDFKLVLVTILETILTKYHQRLRAALGVENAVPPTMIASAGTVSTIFTVSISSFLIFMEKIVFLINTSSLQRVFLLYCQAFRVQNFFADPQCQNADADPDIGSDYRRWVVPFSFLCRIQFRNIYLRCKKTKGLIYQYYLLQEVQVLSI